MLDEMGSWDGRSASCRIADQIAQTASALFKLSTCPFLLCRLAIAYLPVETDTSVRGPHLPPADDGLIRKPGRYTMGSSSVTDLGIASCYRRLS